MIRRKQTNHSRFQSLRFPKTGSEIKDKARTLRQQFADKVQERERRIAKGAEEAGLNSAAEVLYNIDQIAEYASGGGTALTAGLSASIKQEIHARHQEREQIDRLDLVIHNLPEDKVCELTFEELEYLGFYPENE